MRPRALPDLRQIEFRFAIQCPAAYAITAQLGEFGWSYDHAGSASLSLLDPAYGDYSFGANAALDWARLRTSSAQIPVGIPRTTSGEQHGMQQVNAPNQAKRNDLILIIWTPQ